MEWQAPRCFGADTGPVQQFQVLGERNSGTNFVATLLRNNLAEMEETRPYGWKHGFIDRRVVETPGLLTVVVYRHPIRWLQSVHAKPLELTDNFGKLRFEDFLETPWTGGFRRENGPMEPSTADLEPKTGRTFPNPMALRSAKIAYLEEMQKMAGCTAYLRFEDVNRRPKESVRAIADTFGLECPHFRGVSGFKGGAGQYLPKPAPMPTEFEMARITEALDLGLEHKLGYTLEDIPVFDGLSPWDRRSVRSRLRAAFSLRPRWGGSDRRARG